MRNLNLFLTILVTIIYLISCKKDSNDFYNLKQGECIAIESYRDDVLNWQVSYDAFDNIYYRTDYIEESETEHVMNDNQKVSAITYNSERLYQKTEYIYNTDGLVGELTTQSLSYGFNDTVQFTIQYYYNLNNICPLDSTCHNGNCRAINYTDDNCSIVHEEESYTYIINYDGFKSPLSKLLYDTGNLKGNVIEQIRINSDSTQTVISLTDITYNNMGYPVSYYKCGNYTNGDFCNTHTFKYVCIQ